MLRDNNSITVVHVEGQQAMLHIISGTTWQRRRKITHGPEDSNASGDTVTVRIPAYLAKGYSPESKWAQTPAEARKRRWTVKPGDYIARGRIIIRGPKSGPVVPGILSGHEYMMVESISDYLDAGCVAQLVIRGG